MSIPHAPQPAKLVISLLMKDRQVWQRAVPELSRHYGDIDLTSGWISFDFTRYYEAEMGGPLVRRMVAFRQFIEQDQLVEIKLATNRLEDRYRTGAGRSINLDPGYLLQERFVLATGKNYSHRIYIGQGIYADLTLVYQKGRFHPLSWTYPDYRSEAMIGFLNNVRRKYTIDLRQKETAC